MRDFAALRRQLVQQQIAVDRRVLHDEHVQRAPGLWSGACFDPHQAITAAEAADRDLALLASAYTLSSVTPLDMFPQTAEIETVAHVIRRAL